MSASNGHRNRRRLIIHGVTGKSTSHERPELYYGCYDETVQFNSFKVLIYVITIVFGLLNYYANLKLLLNYRDYPELYWTTLCILLTANIVIAIFDTVWYIDDDRKTQEEHQTTLLQWFLRIVAVIMFLGPIWRAVQVIYYGANSHYKKGIIRDYYSKMAFIYATDAGMLNIFEKCLESMPQLFILLTAIIMGLQPQNSDMDKKETGMYFMPETFDNFTCKNATKEVNIFGERLSYSYPCIFGRFRDPILLKIIGTIVGTSWAFISYESNHRIVLENVKKMTILSKMSMITWRLLITSSQFLAMSLFLSVYPYWFCFICGVHWSIMTTWMFHLETNFCGSDRKYLEYLYRFVIGFIHLITFFNPTDGNTTQKSRFYYSVIFFERGAMILIWSFSKGFDMPIVFVLFVYFALIVSGFIFMTIHYAKCHPHS